MQCAVHVHFKNILCGQFLATSWNLGPLLPCIAEVSFLTSIQAHAVVNIATLLGVTRSYCTRRPNYAGYCLFFYAVLQWKLCFEGALWHCLLQLWEFSVTLCFTVGIDMTIGFKCWLLLLHDTTTLSVIGTEGETFVLLLQALHSQI